MGSFFRSPLFIAIVGCFTLGLAPFLPEPHLVGKIRWVMGGAVGMQPKDWFDMFLHASPWLILMHFIIRDVISKI